MTIRTHFGSRATVFTCALALTAACGGTDSHGPHGFGTETDNPSPGKPPKYESPGDFSDDQPKGMPPCGPQRSVGKPSQRPLWGQDGALLIGADMYRGLFAVDTSDPAAPRLMSTTPLAGEVHQVIVEPNAQVTLAIDEVPVGVRDEVPTPDALQPVPRLVRFDANDASAVERVADIDLEGEFWSMRLRGSTLWVMSETVVEPVTSCNRSVYDCGFVDPIALIVAGYRLQDGAWQRVARAELKTSGPAWELPDGYAAFEARFDDNGDATEGTLRFVRFDGDDALASPGKVMIAGEVVPGAPIGLTDALVHVFMLDYMNGNSELDTISLAGGELLSKLDNLPQQQFDYSIFVGDRLIIDGANSGEAARVIDWSDPTAPTSQSFPQDVTRVVSLGDGTRVLGLTSPPELKASLFSMKDGSPELLAQVAVSQGSGAAGIEDVSVAGDRIVIGYQSKTNEYVTVVLIAGDTTLERVSQIDAGYSDEVLLSGDAFYAPDGAGLRAGSIDGGTTQTLSWRRDVTDEVSAGAYRATLARNAAGENVLELSRDGALVSSLAVGPMAERLFADDEHVLVLSLEPRDQCSQSGLDCSQYEPNVAIVTLGDKPAISATVKFTDADALGPTTQGENRIYWDVEGDVALSLGQGRFALVADYEATCQGEDECAALGVEPQPANHTLSPSGAPTCPPGASCTPAPTPAPVATTYGEKQATRLYFLDASASKPSFAAPVDSVLELDDSRFAPPRVSEGTVMITRIERAAAFGTASGSQPAHFMLDRFTVEDHKLHALAPINVPGYPIALGDAGSMLFSAEPDSKTKGAGTLHMLALEDDGANPLGSLPLEATYSDAIAAFGKIFYLRHDGVDCDGNSSLMPFALPKDRDGELQALHAFDLPGGRYRFADARDQRLLLTDDHSHYVVLDVSGDTPKLVKFLSAAFGPNRPTLQGNSISGGASLYAEELNF